MANNIYSPPNSDLGQAPKPVPNNSASLIRWLALPFAVIGAWLAGVLFAVLTSSFLSSLGSRNEWESVLTGLLLGATGVFTVVTSHLIAPTHKHGAALIVYCFGAIIAAIIAVNNLPNKNYALENIFFTGSISAMLFGGISIWLLVRKRGA